MALPKIARTSPLLLLLSAALLSLALTSGEHSNSSAHALYSKLGSNSSRPAYEVLEKALNGYAKLKQEKALGEKALLTVIDFSLSSNKKRLWVIDLAQQKVLHHTLVAHGKHTGEEFAQSFSNTAASHKSSLGFYVTGTTYHGKHGLSLYLDGMEAGFNDNARERTIVMHGADYVNSAFIKKYGRLGRSFGCPALSMSKHKEIINLLANRTCLFIYYPDNHYLQASQLIRKDA